GKLIKCPVCETVDHPPESTLAIPPSVEHTVTEVSCTACGTLLKSPAPLRPDQLVQCLKCGTVFPVPAPEATTAEPDLGSALDSEDWEVDEEEIADSETPEPSEGEKAASRPVKSREKPLAKRRKARKKAGPLWMWVLVGLLLLISLGLTVALA